MQKTGTNQRTVFKTKHTSVVICKNPKNNNFLAIHETKNRGWGSPKGTCDENESFIRAAVRECFEESHVEVKIIGILKVIH